MKKIFTILAMSALAFTSAQANAFNGSDFENFTDFTTSVNSFGLKSYATQGVGKGVGGSASLNINASPTANDYVFTALPTATLPTNLKAITLMVKGTSTGGKSMSFNVYSSDGTSYYKFNLGDLTTTPVTLVPEASNSYTGSIDTGGTWVKVTLDLTGITDVNTVSTENFFALKIGKTATFDIDIDNIIAIDGNLAVHDISKVNKTLVKNTNVSNSIMFSGKSDIKILNMNGQVVKTASVNENTALNVSSLDKGIYIVTGVVDGEKVSQKIMKN